MRLPKLWLVLALILLGLASATQTVLEPGPSNPSEQAPNRSDQKVDDWAYSGRDNSKGRSGTTPSPTMRSPAPLAQDAGSARLGYSVGGAQDVENFRENVASGYLPLPSDLTYEGLFHDYYFDTGEGKPCQHLFCPSYSQAVSPDPLSGKPQRYLTVGLNADVTEADFERKRLNLVIVLDISGSMSSPFDRYYYDRSGQRQEVDPAEGAGKSKMALAAESVAALMEHLNADDRFGMVLFNGGAHLAKPLSRVGNTDMDAIREHVLELRAGGSTHMSAGMRMGTRLFDELAGADPAKYENRIIFLTDAMPNRGATDDDDLLSLAQRNAERGIYGTFVGIGVDFNSELVETIGTIRGANYHAVHSAEQFRERLDEGFAYMVTPLVFDLELTLDAPGYRIAQAYGSPGADEATGRLMSVNTLFPSRTKDGETRGGVVLLRLQRSADGERAAASDRAVLRVRYTDRHGHVERVETAITLSDRAPDDDDTGIRKAVLLARYADLLQNWLIDERRSQEADAPIEPSVSTEFGIRPPELEPWLGRWERQSTPLSVSGHYRDLFRRFRDHMRSEMAELDDPSLQRELDLLATLADAD